MHPSHGYEPDQAAEVWAILMCVCVSLSCICRGYSRDGGTLTDDAEATYAGEGWRTIGGAGQRQREAARHGSSTGGSKL